MIGAVSCGGGGGVSTGTMGATGVASGGLRLRNLERFRSGLLRERHRRRHPGPAPAGTPDWQSDRAARRAMSASSASTSVRIERAARRAAPATRRARPLDVRAPCGRRSNPRRATPSRPLRVPCEASRRQAPEPLGQSWLSDASSHSITSPLTSAGRTSTRTRAVVQSRCRWTARERLSCLLWLSC